MNPPPSRDVEERPIPRPLARASLTVTPTGRTEAMTFEIVVFDREDDNPRATTREGLLALGINREAAGWRHYAVEDLQAFVRVVSS